MKEIKEYEYHGYTLKQVPKEVGFGFMWAIYKDDKLIGCDYQEKRAKETADWHAQYAHI